MSPSVSSRAFDYGVQHTIQALALRVHNTLKQHDSGAGGDSKPLNLVPSITTVLRENVSHFKFTVHEYQCLYGIQKVTCLRWS